MIYFQPFDKTLSHENDTILSTILHVHGARLKIKRFFFQLQVIGCLLKFTIVAPYTVLEKRTLLEYKTPI